MMYHQIPNPFLGNPDNRFNLKPKVKPPEQVKELRNVKTIFMPIEFLYVLRHPDLLPNHLSELL